MIELEGIERTYYRPGGAPVENGLDKEFVGPTMGNIEY